MIGGRYLSITSRRMVSMKSFFGKKKINKDEATRELTAEEKGNLKSRLAAFTSENKINKEEGKTLNIFSEDADDEIELTPEDCDSIRARGILPYNYNYDPPSNLKDIIADVVSSVISTDEKDFSKIDLTNNLKNKASLLIKLGNDVRHHIPSSKLHEMKTVADVYSFYSEPVKNTTEYVDMARDPTTPTNVFMREEAHRFHPNDASAYHGGVTAFPGTGGEVYGLRNKRILKEFDPRKEWYDYDDMAYDYKKYDANLPWDERIAEKMDRYVDRRYVINVVKKN